MPGPRPSVRQPFAVHIPRSVEDAAPYRTSRQVCRGRIYAARSLPAGRRLPYTSRGAVKTAPYKPPVIVIL